MYKVTVELITDTSDAQVHKVAITDATNFIGNEFISGILKYTDGDTIKWETTVVDQHDE